MRRLRKLARVAVGVYVKEMRIWFRYPSWLLTFAALPYMVSGLFNGVGYSIAGPKAFENFAKNTGVSNPFLFYTLGTALLIASQLILQDTASSIRSEQLMGTFELHYLTPTPTYIIWLLHIFPHFTVTMMVLLAATLPILAYSGAIISPLDLLYASIVLLLGMLPLLGISLVLASLVVRYKEPWALINVVQSIISLLSGYFYPLTVFPEWVRILAQVVPTSHVVEILREVFLFNRGIALSDSRILLLLTLLLVYPIVGLMFYMRWERIARRRGELSKY